MRRPVITGFEIQYFLPLAFEDPDKLCAALANDGWEPCGGKTLLATLWEDADFEEILAPIDDIALQRKQSDLRENIRNNIEQSTINYFHPFVRDLLFAEPKNSSSRSNELPPITVYQPRKGGQVSEPSRITMTGFSDETKQIVTATLDIKSRYIVRLATGVIVYWTRLRLNDAPVSINVVQEITDRLRQAYPPYWKFADVDYQYGKPQAECIPGHHPESITVFNKDDQNLLSLNFMDEDALSNSVENKPTLSRHWQKLIGEQVSELAEIRLDERIPYCSWVECPDLQLLTEGDWLRLATGGESGNSDGTPYARRYVSEMLEKTTLDWFYEPKSAGAQKDVNHGWMTTRHLMTGYGYTMVGSGDYITNAASGGLAAFRRPYALMFLICQAYAASVIDLQQQLSKAAGKLFNARTAAQRDDTNIKVQEARSAVQRIHIKILDFSHDYWFDQLSNQVQARELFSRWKTFLELDQAYERLRSDASELIHWEDVNLQQSDTRAAQRLNLIAMVGLFAALIVGFFGMNHFGGDTHELTTTRTLSAVVGLFILWSIAVLLVGRFQNQLTGLLFRWSHVGGIRFTVIAMLVAAAAAWLGFDYVIGDGKGTTTIIDWFSSKFQSLKADPNAG
ncbi:hypothetical protein OAS86_05900 [Gammaproteobacteria bacterium]|nr:hypothetical protein [Gammaproteobacteria bacterium]